MVAFLPFAFVSVWRAEAFLSPLSNILPQYHSNIALDRCHYHADGGLSRKRILFVLQVHREAGGEDPCDVATTRDPELLLQWNVLTLLSTNNAYNTTEYRNDDATRIEMLAQVHQAAVQVLKTEASSFQTQPQHGVAPHLPVSLASVARFVKMSPESMDHDGNFRIFADTKQQLRKRQELSVGPDDCNNMDASAKPTIATVSLPANVVFSMDQQLAFLRQNVAYGPRERGRSSKKNQETVVFCGDSHHNDDSQPLRFLSRVLDGMLLSELCVGSFSRPQKGADCGYLRVLLPVETLQKLEAAGLLVPSSALTERLQQVNGASSPIVHCQLQCQDLDLIRTVLASSLTPLHPQGSFPALASLVKLIDTAVEAIRKDPLGGGEPHLVLMTHSASASLVAAALQLWKDSKKQRPKHHRHHWESLLHQAVTVVTLGALTQHFVHGPAYLHISMLDDPWARQLGFGSHETNGGDSQDAVILRAWSPYDLDNDGDISSQRYKEWKGHDSHNLCACLIQFVALVMRVNGLRSFRQLYNTACVHKSKEEDIDERKFFALNYSRFQVGELVLPPSLDYELLPAFVRATGGHAWLWNPLQESLLPDNNEAKCYLEEQFGYLAFEDIYEACCGSGNA